MAKLTEQLQTEIIIKLACFRTASQVVAALEAEHGVTLSIQQVLFYHPARTCGGRDKRLAEKWRVLFEAARESYLEDVSAVGIAHQRYRIDVLQQLLDAELDRGGHNRMCLWHPVE